MRSGMTPKTGRENGFTLLETAISIAIAAVILAALGRVLFATTGSTDYLVSDSTGRRDMQRALDILQNEVRQSTPSTISVISSSGQHDILTLQTAGPWSGENEWGAVDVSGAWHEDWSARYRVVQSTLVRETLDALGTVQGAPVTLVRYVADVAGSTRGFEVEQNGPVLVLRIRTRRTFSDGVENDDTLTTSVHVMN